jgi:hypothetical protein
MNSSDLNNLIKVPVSLQKNFFKYWVEFLRPIHHLTPVEMQILACLLRERYFLSKKVSDDAILDNIVFSTEIRRKILAECEISNVLLSTKLGKFRKEGIIIQGRINPRLIPNLKEEKGNFKLLLFFKFEDEDKGKEKEGSVPASGKAARNKSRKG